MGARPSLRLAGGDRQVPLRRNQFPTPCNNHQLPPQRQFPPQAAREATKAKEFPAFCYFDQLKEREPTGSLPFLRLWMSAAAAATAIVATAIAAATIAIVAAEKITIATAAADDHDENEDPDPGTAITKTTHLSFTSQ